MKDLVGGDFTCEQLEAAGLSARSLRAGGAEQLRAIGFSAGKLKAGGFSAAQLKAAGFDAAALKAAGFGVSELFYQAFFDAAALQAAGYTARDCYLDSVEPEVIPQVVGPCSLEALLKAGYGPLRLDRNSCYTRKDFLEAGVRPEVLNKNDKLWSTPC